MAKRFVPDISGLDKRQFGDDMLHLILEWVYIELEPHQVFSPEILDRWAEENGYVKEEK